MAQGVQITCIIKTDRQNPHERIQSVGGVDAFLKAHQWGAYRGLASPLSPATIPIIPAFPTP